MLKMIGGKPLIVHTAERARSASLVDRVIVATDDERIVEAVTDAGFEAVMTSTEHRSGTDRIAEVAKDLPAGTIVVNVQGDEPTIDPSVIDAAVDALSDGIDIATTCESIENADQVMSPTIVKVATAHNGRAMYFSRSVVPYPRDAVIANGSLRTAFENEPNLLRGYFRHTGLYVYRREFLLEFASWPQSELEIAESLEQLRALERGCEIRVVKVAKTSIGVDTADDLEIVSDLIGANIASKASTSES